MSEIQDDKDGREFIFETHPTSDLLLRDIVFWANQLEVRPEDDTKVSLTVWAGGQAIGGYVSTYSYFLENSLSHIRAVNFTEEQLGSLEEFKAKYLDGAKRAIEAKTSPFFIHLHDARSVQTLANGRLAIQQYGVWRGRLSAVDAWCFGIAGEPPVS